MPLLMAALIGSSLVFYTVYKRRVRCGSMLCALSVLIFFWLLLYMLELWLPGEANKRLMLDLQYFAIPCIAPVFFIYVLAYTGEKPSAGSVAALFVIPACASVACWTNAYHGLFYTSLGLRAFSGTSVLLRSYNALFYFYLAYAALLMLLCAVRLASHYSRMNRILIWQLALLLSSVLLPFLSGVFSYAFSLPFNFMPVSLVVSMYLIVWLTNDFSFLPTLPLKRDVCFELSDAALFQIDAERRVLDLNAAAAELLQRRPDELLMQDLSALFSELTHGARLLFSGDEEMRVSRGATDADYAVHTNPIKDGAFVTVRDIGQQKRNEERQSYFKNFDSLTALPNRGLFYRLLRRELDHTKRYGEVLSVLALEVDGFHDIREFYGYQAGDRVLLELSRRLADGLRKADTISRFDNDEFYIVLPRLSLENMPAVIERLLEALSAPIKNGNDQIEVTLSVGAARAPEDADEPDELLALARTALRSRQPKTRNSYQLHMPGLEEDEYRADDDVMRVLESGAAKCAYTPIAGEFETAMLQGKVFAESEGDRELFPGSALTSYTQEIDLHLMHMLLGDYRARFMENGPMLLLPFRQRLLKQDFVERFCQSLRQYGYDRSGIALIVYPAALSHRAEETRASIKALSEAGARFVLDGFEANHSLTRLIIENDVKFARLSENLVANIDDRSDYLLTEAAVYVAKRANVTLQAIAPSEASGNKLRAAGIDWIGFVK